MTEPEGAQPWTRRMQRRAGRRKDLFLRIGLPLILLLVGAVIALFVLNAFEVTELMETEKRAGPTLLNR